MFYAPPTGRLNVLANVVRKPLAQIFHEFDHGSSIEDDSWGATGDVKYHLGTSYDRPTRSGKKVHSKRRNRKVASSKVLFSPIYSA
jgi:2-oxoglutarate dehydrogenase E1 component